MRLLFHDPMETMLDRFNHSERQRLLPRWKRAAFRLSLVTLATFILASWVIAACWEAGR